MSDTTFTALDFETAQHCRSSICQVGLVRVENGHVVSELSFLVRPPDNFYLYRFSEIHGLTPRDTANAPDFATLWPRILPLIAHQTVVAHNTGFDISCLRKTLDHYALQHPQFVTACTYKIYRSNLATLCQAFNIPLNHHDALSDARACAELYKRHLSKINLTQ